MKGHHREFFNFVKQDLVLSIVRRKIRTCFLCIIYIMWLIWFLLAHSIVPHQNIIKLPHIFEGVKLSTPGWCRLLLIFSILGMKMVFLSRKKEPPPSNICKNFLMFKFFESLMTWSSSFLFLQNYSPLFLAFSQLPSSWLRCFVQSGWRLLSNG